MINVGLIGTGRIGRVHAESIARNRQAHLQVICDTCPEAGKTLACKYDTSFSAAPQEVIQDKSIDAVFICTPAHSHIDLMEAALATGKYVFCEKPLDEDLEKARRFVSTHPDWVARVMVGFHRRFDDSHQKLRKTVESGALGSIEQIIINSRDPRLDSYDVLKGTGGIFRDMMMHDVDQASTLTQESFAGVVARAACFVDPVFIKNGDFDTATATFWTASGVTCTIFNSRRSLFGFEQTIELFFSGGTAAIRAPSATSFSIRDEAGEHIDGPKGHFIERYRNAYNAECCAFLEAIESGAGFPVSAVDGLRALALADAADRSARLGQLVALVE
jgi:myo-inositol 2-dehydrogenase/D-chiro-inositol 1-dehydrogenase